jgi:hypothetical protein
VEADVMLNAQSFSPGLLNDNPFHPPHNWLSNFRDPGTVNINTIYAPHVWNALLGGDPAGTGAPYQLGPTFDKIVASRRGYGTSNDILERSTDSPTEFAHVFRPVGTGDMGTNIPAMTVTNPIDATLLRRDTDANAGGLPLLMNATGTTQGTQNATFNNATRHSAFRHNTLGRLSNTITTRSNVYAMWVTMGYFEVDGSGLLGQELNSDTGEIKRHRAFYMIDRSIPVGFEPGENHNVDRAILVRRYIE